MSERQAKKAQFENSGRSRRPLVLVAAVLLLAAVGAGAWLLKSSAPGGAFAPVTAHAGEVTIPAADLADGQARFYRFEGREGEVEFFLVQSADGLIRAAFDTCDVCYKARKGYRQEGNLMVCNNCDQAFPVERINVVKGGCNPAPLERQLRDGQVVIRTADLERGRPYFAVAAN